MPMPVKLTLFSFEYESYDGYLAFAHDNPSDVLGIHKSAQLNATTPGKLEAVFDDLTTDRTWYFYLRRDDELSWRSGPIHITDSDQEIALRIFTINTDQTIYTEDQLELEVELPFSDKVFPDDDNSTKMVQVDFLSINIRSIDILFSGAGVVGDLNEDGAIQVESNFTFTYLVQLKPSSLYFSTDRFLNIVPLDDPNLQFDNILTGFLVGIYNFFTGEVSKGVEKAFESTLNESIKAEVSARLDGLSEEEMERILPTVQKVELEEGERIRFTTVVSMPAEFFQQQVSQGCGQTASVLLLFVLALGGLLFSSFL